MPSPVPIPRRAPQRAAPVLAALAVSALLACAQAAPPLEPLVERLADLVPGDRVGIVVGWSDGERTEIRSVGAAGFGADTLFEYGSITKLFTAAALAVLAEEGTVALDDPVARHLPDEVEASARARWERATLADLAVHGAGLPRLPPNLGGLQILLQGRADDPYAGFGRDDLVWAVENTEPDPAAPWAYSNYGAGLLGALLADAAERSYADLVRARLLAPLGMDATTLTGWSSDDVAQPLAQTGAPVSAWSFDALAGAGAARGSARDALRFVGAAAGACDAAAGPGGGTLERALCRTLQPVGVRVDADTRMALGWLRTTVDGAEVVWHNGGTGGSSAFLGFEPESGVGLVILANLADLRAIDAAGLEWLAAAR